MNLLQCYAFGSSQPYDQERMACIDRSSAFAYRGHGSVSYGSLPPPCCTPKSPNSVFSTGFSPSRVTTCATVLCLDIKNALHTTIHATLPAPQPSDWLLQLLLFFLFARCPGLCSCPHHELQWPARPPLTYRGFCNTPLIEPNICLSNLSTSHLPPLLK
jgi:hypothetical protein